MLKTIVLSNFEILYHEMEMNKDYNMVISFTPITPDESVFGIDKLKLNVPHVNGLIDTSINSDDYFCSLIVDDEVKSMVGRPHVLFCWFTKKIKKTFTESKLDEPAKVAQFADKSVGTSFRQIKSPDGSAYLNISDDIVEIVAGDNKFTVSKDQISSHCDTVDYNLPSTNQGGIFKETGIFRFLPKCFIPPFSMPDYLPDTRLLLAIAMNIDVIKELIQMLDEKEEG